MTNLVSLPRLSAAIAALTGGKPPNYHTMWKKIVSSELPAERIDGRWYADPRAVAIGLGLIQTEATPSN